MSRGVQVWGGVMPLGFMSGGFMSGGLCPRTETGFKDARINCH